MFVSAEPVNTVAVSVLSMRVAMLSREDARTTHGARGTCTECVVEDNRTFCKGIDVWSSDNRISVALRDPAPIVSNDEHDAFISVIHDSPFRCDKRAIRLGSRAFHLPNLLRCR